MSNHSAADIDKRVRAYLMVGASLLMLTGLTVGVAYMEMPVTELSVPSFREVLAVSMPYIPEQRTNRCKIRGIRLPQRLG